MKGSLIIVGFFALGCLTGLFNLVPFNIAETDISFYALWIVHKRLHHQLSVAGQRCLKRILMIFHMRRCQF